MWTRPSQHDFDFADNGNIANNANIHVNISIIGGINANITINIADIIGNIGANANNSTNNIEDGAIIRIS